MKRPALALIRWYQGSVSPTRPPACRFQPTCSHYGYAAIERYGLLRGGFLTLWPTLLCHPFNPAGHAPVPRRDADKKTIPH